MPAESARLTLGLLVVLLVALPACDVGTSGPSVDTQVDALGVQISRFRGQKADIAESQQQADTRLKAVLDAVRVLDEFVVGMRDTETIDDVKDGWDEVDAVFGLAETEDLRQPLFSLARKVDSARTTLTRAQEAVEEDWERGYLDAEDEVLVAVRAYAASADALAQVLLNHWSTYAAVHAANVQFFETRWVYRSDDEATAAYEVRVGRLLDDLATAQAEIATFRGERQAAAVAVNAASDRAAVAWANRPSDAPTGTGGADASP